MNKPSLTVSQEEALIYVMVTLAAADRTITDRELLMIGDIVRRMPIFESFDQERLVKIAEDCGARLQDGDLDKMLDLIAESLPARLHDTAYALAVEVAAADIEVEQEELRFLQLLRDQLDLDKLTVAAIERGARARYRRP